MIRLVDVYTEIAESRLATKFLYKLLEERDPVANISHREMPKFERHMQFIKSKPYQAWYFILADDVAVGSIYLTHPPSASRAGNEIGVSILKMDQGKGYGKKAVCLLMDMHPGKKFLANIAPGNARSIAMFEGLGFKTIQLTLAKEQTMADDVIQFPQKQPSDKLEPGNPNALVTTDGDILNVGIIDMPSPEFAKLDFDALFNMRRWVEEALKAKGAKVIGAGIGVGGTMGIADIQIELDGHECNIEIRPLKRS